MRRIIIALLAMFAVSLSVCEVSDASGGKKARIAVVISSSIEPYMESINGFYQELDARGVKYESSEFIMSDSDNLESVIPKIALFRPDLIHTIGTRATAAVKEEFKDVPVIFSMVLNPVDSGIVASMEFPGDNITGVSMDIPLRLQFDYIKRIFPRAKKIGVIYSKEETAHLIGHANIAARRAGMTLVDKEVKYPAEVPAALTAIAGKIDLLWSVADSNVFTRETIREFLIFTLKRQIPFVGLSSSFVRAGAFFSFDVIPEKAGRDAAVIADEVLRGKNTARIPVLSPKEIKVFINKNTANILNIDVPDEIYKSAEIINP